MATPRDQQVLSYAISGTTTTVSHTVRPGANRLLLVELMGRFASDTSVTYGGAGLTLVSGSQNGAGTAGAAHRRVAMYYLIAPTEGTANLVVVITGNTQGTIRARNMVDVDQSTPLRSQGSDLALSSSGTSSTSDTLTPATTSGDLVLDLIAVSTTPTIGSGQTLAGFGTPPTNQRSSTKVATSSSESMAWTYSSGTFAHCAVSIVGSTATQPAPEDYTGSRGKKSWHVQAQITTGETVSAGASNYIPIGPSVESSGAESVIGRLAARVPGTWSDPEIYVTANATTSASTLTMLEDGTDTGLSITITAGTTGRFAGSGTLSVDGTTGLSWRITNGGGGSITLSMVGLAFEPDGADTVTVLTAHSSSASQLTAGATHYMGVQGSRGFTSTLASAELQLPLGGVWEGLNVINPAGNTTTGTVDIGSFINGAAGNQALAWAASENDTLEDTTHTDTVADGDLINWQAVVGAGTGTFETERWASRLINEDGEFLMLSAASPAGGGIALSNGANYFPMAGECGRTSTEAAAQMSVPFDAAIKRLIVRLAENTSLLPAVATLRVNGTDTALTLEIQPGIAEVVFSQPWDVVDVDAGDLLTINIQQGGANNVARVRYVGVVGVERSAAAVTGTATTSLALAVQQARAIAAGMQVAVQTSGQSTTSASAAVQAARTAQAGLTAAVQQAHSAVASLAAAVQAPGVQSTALAAAVQLAGSAVTSLDLAVQAQGSATTGVSLQVQAGSSVSTGVSLQVQAGSSVSVAASLAVLRQALATVGLSTAVVAPGSASTGLSVALRAAQSATSALALAVQVARTVSTSVSLQVQDGLSIAAALNVAVQRAASATTAVQLAIAQAANASASLAAAVMVQRSVAAATSAAVRAGRSAGAGVGLFVFDAGPVDPDAAAVWSHVLSNGKTAGQNQVEIHAMLTALIAGAHVLPVDVLKMNSAPVIGDGTVGNDWRGVGVQPQ